MYDASHIKFLANKNKDNFYGKIKIQIIFKKISLRG